MSHKQNRNKTFGYREHGTRNPVHHNEWVALRKKLRWLTKAWKQAIK